MDIFENIQKELEDLVKSKQALIHRNKRKDAYSLSPDRLLSLNWIRSLVTFFRIELFV